MNGDHVTAPPGVAASAHSPRSSLKWSLAQPALVRMNHVFAERDTPYCTSSTIGSRLTSDSEGSLTSIARISFSVFEPWRTSTYARSAVVPQPTRNISFFELKSSLSLGENSSLPSHASPSL